MKIKSKIKKILGKIIKTTYKFWCKYVPVDEKTILFVAFHGRGYNCNPKYLHQYLSNSEEYKDCNFVWAVKNKYEDKIPNCKIIRYGGVKYFYYLAKSKYWIVNCKLPKYTIKKSNQVYLQTWHGTPLKRLAHDIESKEDITFYRTEMSRKEMLDTYDCDVKKYDFLISPNSFATEKFKSAFKIDPKKIIETGYPRNDFLVNSTDEDIIRLREKYKIPKERKVILYAPTWRDNVYNNKGYSYEVQADFKMWRKLLGDEYVLLFKPHYLIIDNYSNEGIEDFVYIIGESADINELYVISDMLVTDYSSVFFDYSILRRPILFYMYDLEEYRDELRGFYLDINKDLPGKICVTEKELIYEIMNIDKSEVASKLNVFNKKFNLLENGKASEKVIKKIFTKD